MKQMPVNFPDDAVEDEEFATFLFNMSERRVKRSAGQVEANAGDAIGADLLQLTPKVKTQRLKALIQETSEKLLHL